MPTLHVLQGPDKGRTYDTPNEPVVIGRESDQIHLTDNGASRRHAEIRPRNGCWVLTDLKSSNGTYLNGQRVVAPTALHHGDQIKVGSTLLVFSGKDGAEGFHALLKGHDLVDLDKSGSPGGSSILSALDASEDSVILQAPETADAVAAWNVVYKIAETLGASTTTDAFLNRVADVLFEHLIMDRLIILLKSGKTDDLHPHVFRYRTRDRRQAPQAAASRTIINHVVQNRAGVLCANAMTDNRFGRENSQDSIHRLGLRSIICVPIVARDMIHGVIHMDCSMSYHTYTHEQLRLVVAIGRLAGMAIDNFGLLESRMKTERLAAAGEAVAYVSHHIRNILQGMQGGADVVELAMKKQNFETLQSGWRLIRRNLDRIFLLAMNMLTFSKDRQPRIESTQLNRIVEDVIELAQSRTDEKHVMLLTELDDIPAAPLDPEGIHQVTLNIVINAIDAVADQGGRVNIATAYDQQAAQVILAVTDNGPGIPPEDRSKIFDVFHSSKGHGGTGLGLAAAKKIVDELGGRIEVDSTVGEGTTFRVLIPASHVKLADSHKTHGPAQSPAR